MIAVILLEKINALIQSAVSWSRQNSGAHEELSCSYQPSRKKHEDVVDNYLNSRGFSKTMSEDVIDYNSFKPSGSQYGNDNNSNRDDDNESNNDSDINELVDAYELRRRLRKMNTSQPKRYVKPIREPVQFME